MSDLGSITALKEATAQLLSKKKAPAKIIPQEHRNLLYDVIDTLAALISVSTVTKNVWTGNLTLGNNYIDISEIVSSTDFIYEVISWSATKGAYEPTEVLEIERSDILLTIYVGEAKPTSRITFI